MSKKWIISVSAIVAIELCFTVLLYFLFRFDYTAAADTIDITTEELNEELTMEVPVNDENISETIEEIITAVEPVETRPTETTTNEITTVQTTTPKVTTTATQTETPDDFPSEEAVEANKPINSIDSDWAFFLINRENLLSESYKVSLSKVQGDYSMDARASEYAKEMIAAALEDGIDLMVCSAYRSPKYQKNNFDRFVTKLITSGYTEEDAIAVTSTQIAPPYASEHCAGLALDIISRDWWNYNTDISQTFDQTKEFKWLVENSWKYGFILRYLKGKEDITGYIYEPWHYRFIGIEQARKVTESGLCLEEYFETLQ